MGCKVQEDLYLLRNGDLVCWRNARRLGCIPTVATALFIMPLALLVILLEQLLLLVYVVYDGCTMGLVDVCVCIVWAATCFYCGDEQQRPIGCLQRLQRETRNVTDGNPRVEVRAAGPWEECDCRRDFCAYEPPSEDMLTPLVAVAVAGGGGGIVASLPPGGGNTASVSLPAQHVAVTVQPASPSAPPPHDVVAAPLQSPPAVLPSAPPPPHERMEGEPPFEP